MDEGQQKLLYLFERPFERLNVPRKRGQMIYLMEGEDSGGGLRSGIATIVNIPAMPTILEQLNVAKQVKKGTPYSQFNPLHREAARELTRIFMGNGVENADQLADVAATVKDHVNEGLFIYALSYAIIRNPGLDSRMIPPISEVLPNKFIPQHTMDQVSSQLISRQYENTGTPAEELVVKHDIDFTGSDINPEHRVAYFREDYGLNSHHWHWHVIFPIDDDTIVRDRKGEIFFYMHNQMMARYDWERLSNRLNRVVKLNDWREPIPEGYFPKLTVNNSNKQYGGRPDNMTPQNFTRIDKIDENFHPFDINDMERWRQRIFDAIHQGFMIDSNGERVPLSDDVPEDQKRGIDLLGDALEADSVLSKNPAFYGSLHNLGHDLIAFIHDPHGYHKEEIGAIGDTATSCRDPAFWRWHKFVDDVFVEYKMMQKPYKDEELVFNPVKVVSVTVKTSNLEEENALETGWYHRPITASRGLDFLAPGIDVKVELQHLTHTPFTYNIEVANNQDNPVDVTVRIYMAPKFNVAGREMTFMEQRLLWAEMDRYQHTLEPGLNSIERSSEHSSITIPDELTFQDLEDYKPEEASEFCGCGWPQHLLLPMGQVQGMDYQIFVLISDWKLDEVEDSAGKKCCSNAASFCGILNSKYPDARPMGYPFDRKPNAKINGYNGADNKGIASFDDYAKALPNALMCDIKIYFRDRVLGTSSSREITFSS